MELMDQQGSYCKQLYVTNIIVCHLNIFYCYGQTHYFQIDVKNNPKAYGPFFPATIF